MKHISSKEKEEIKDQIAFYKKHRSIFQYGQFTRRISDKSNKVTWSCTRKDGKEAVAGFFQTMVNASEGCDLLQVSNMKPGIAYTIETNPQNLYIKRFGALLKHVLPISLNPEGIILTTANRHYTLKDCVESYQVDSVMLTHGIPLNNQFMGSNYNEQTRMLGDFGSNLYLIYTNK